MPSLIANIGTSDIAVKVGDYYLPIGFDRQEPNLEEPDDSLPEGAIWHGRWLLLSKMFEEELEINPKSKFREICQALLVAYRQDPENWHSRISIGRIRGVIDSTLSAESQIRADNETIAYLVVTDQPKTEKNGYPTDTIYAFEIIQDWLSHQVPDLVLGDSPKLQLKQNTINVSAIDEDLLHEHYYRLFQNFSPDDTVYLSAKGGTYQMQQALKVQALASNTQAQIFLSPKPQISKILAGQPSDCQRVAYWRYQQNQRYQMVQSLLNRWDFEGAAVLLQDWEKTLGNLVVDDETVLQQQQIRLSQAVQGLRKAVAHLNLDTAAVNELATGDSDLETALSRYTTAETLYTQCKIFVELKQISHFLARLGTFYEETQLCLIEKLGGLEYSTESNRGLAISAEKIERSAPQLHQRLQKKLGKRSDDSKPNVWKLGDRGKKLSYIKALLRERFDESPARRQTIIKPWQKLDFWYVARNELTHGAEGINESRLEKVYQERGKNAQIACSYADIFRTMEEILTFISNLEAEPEDARIQSSLGFGPYGLIREWAIATLKS